MRSPGRDPSKKKVFRSISLIKADNLRRLLSDCSSPRPQDHLLAGIMATSHGRRILSVVGFHPLLRHNSSSFSAMRHAGFWLLTCISYSLRYGAAVPEQLREERVLCLTDPEEDQESTRAWAHHVQKKRQGTLV